MPFTKTMTVTVAEQDIVAGSYTKRLTIAEDPSVVGWPTTDYLIKKPDSSSTAIRRATGTSFTFEGNYHPGQVLGRLALIAAATDTTFQQDEE